MAPDCKVFTRMQAGQKWKSMHRQNGGGKKKEGEMEGLVMRKPASEARINPKTGPDSLSGTRLHAVSLIAKEHF
ncbi:hypothetical protein EYF80_005041 [Liparis tanakae]|uniref:Uncharacterized protein n=1 Tax=Liparis tanakae TaxID=230148 RepID=A0A4Z2J360_9TELE|nr:hypothetical protein EYF80_005041 [Liparis tanakae]